MAHERFYLPLGPRYVMRSSIVGDADSLQYGHSRIRLDDVVEWHDSVRGGITGNLRRSIETAAECYTVEEIGERRQAHIIFGVHQADPLPMTWMLGTEQGQQDCAWMLQYAREFYADFFKRWPNTCCYSAPDNKVHHRWLEWMGYEHTGIVPWGDFGFDFYEFIKREAR